MTGKHLRWVMGTMAGLLAALGCADRGHAPEPSDEPSAWYRRATALDLTADQRVDTARLEAHGKAVDSLRIRLVLIVDGKELHHEEWGSSYELALIDSTMTSSEQRDARLRARLDTVLARVTVESLEASGIRLVAEDSAVLAGLEPRPSERISFSYGYETTVRLVWDAPRRRFVRLWSCC